MSNTEQAKWYILHTYSGYENIVKANLEQMIENNGFSQEILRKYLNELPTMK